MYASPLQASAATATARLAKPRMVLATPNRPSAVSRSEHFHSHQFVSCCCAGDWWMACTNARNSSGVRCSHVVSNYCKSEPLKRLRLDPAAGERAAHTVERVDELDALRQQPQRPTEVVGRDVNDVGVQRVTLDG